MSTKSRSFVYNWKHENCPLYKVVGCPLFRGCLSIEANGRTVKTFKIVRYIIERVLKRGSTVNNITLLVRYSFYL